jgi:hypothetical protein
MTMITERRIDAYRAKVRHTPEGYAILEGIAALPGVLEYHYADGRKVRELVLKDVLASEDNLTSLRNAPLCSGHPPVPVNNGNWREYARGTVTDALWCDESQGVKVKTLAQDGGFIQEILEEELEELSCGYEVGIEQTRGTHPVYGEYDQIQVYRRNNHLAAVHQARAGERARFHLDGADTPDPTLAILHRSDTVTVTPKSKTMDKVKMRFDGLEFEVDQVTAMAIRAQQREDAANLDRVTKELERYKADMDIMSAKRDAIEQELNAMKEKLAAIMGQMQAPPAKVEEEVKVEEDGMTPDAEIEIEVAPEDAEMFGDLLEVVEEEVVVDQEMQDMQDPMKKDGLKNVTQQRLDASIQLRDDAVTLFGFKADSVKRSSDAQIKRACVANTIGTVEAKKISALHLDDAYQTVLAQVKKRADSLNGGNLQSAATHTPRPRTDSIQDADEAKAHAAYVARLMGKKTA